MAFQNKWNKDHADDMITPDGWAGKATVTRILKELGENVTEPTTVLPVVTNEVVPAVGSEVVPVATNEVVPAVTNEVVPEITNEATSPLLKNFTETYPEAASVLAIFDITDDENLGKILTLMK